MLIGDATGTTPLNAPLTVPLSEERRELMLRAMDGVNDLGGSMFIFHGYVHCDAILLWLVAHGWTGRALQEHIVKQFRSSVPALVDYVVSAANGRVPSNARTPHT